MPRKIRIFYFLFIFLLVSSFFAPQVKASFIDDLINRISQNLTTNEIPKDLNESNCANLPAGLCESIQQIDITPVEASPSGTNVKGVSTSSDNSSIVEAAKGYTIQSGFYQSSGQSKVTNVLDILWNFLTSIFKLNEEGQNNAGLVLQGILPPNITITPEDKRMDQAFLKERCFFAPRQICPGEENPFDKVTVSPTFYPATPTVAPGQPTPTPTTINDNSSDLCVVTADTNSHCYWHKPEDPSRDFLAVFNGSERDAKIASKICMRESGGVADSVNDHCLTKYDEEDRTQDYSVGLFQLNLLAHQELLCGEKLLIDDWNSTDPEKKHSCSINKSITDAQSKLQQCVDRLSNVADNIAAMKQIYDKAVGYYGDGWHPWSTYDANDFTKCTQLYEGSNPNQSQVRCAAASSNGCPDSSTCLSVPNTEYKRLFQNLGCHKPSMIVIHWSGAWTDVESTYNTLNQFRSDDKGNTYRLSCQFATDPERQLQMLDFWNDQQVWGYCVGGDENVISVNDEITGAYFDDFINDRYEFVESPNDNSSRLKKQTDRSIATTCWVMKQYGIPVSSIIGHFEAPYGKLVGKQDPGTRYIQYYRNRVYNECK